MNDTQKIALLEATLREILKVDEDAAKGNVPGCMPFQYALDGELRYRWIDIKMKAKQLLNGTVR